MTNDSQPLINGLTRSETDASASVAGVSAATLIPGVLQPHAAPAYAALSPAGVPNSVTVEFKAGNEFLGYHPQASHVSPDYRDGWNHCYADAQSRIASLTADLAEARAKLDRVTLARVDALLEIEELRAAIKAAATAPDRADSSKVQP